jgi:hypothetical protein
MEVADMLLFDDRDEISDELFDQLVEGGSCVMIAENNQYSVRVMEQGGELIVQMFDTRGRSYDRVFPVGGFSKGQRKQIAEEVLGYMTEQLPVMWERVISKHIKGYWDSVNWDVITVHNLSRSPKETV